MSKLDQGECVVLDGIKVNYFDLSNWFLILDFLPYSIIFLSNYQRIKQLEIISYVSLFLWTWKRYSLVFYICDKRNQVWVINICFETIPLSLLNKICWGRKKRGKSTCVIVKQLNRKRETSLHTQSILIFFFLIIPFNIAKAKYSRGRICVCKADFNGRVSRIETQWCNRDLKYETQIKLNPRGIESIACVYFCLN